MDKNRDENESEINCNSQNNSFLSDNSIQHKREYKRYNNNSSKRKKKYLLLLLLLITVISMLLPILSFFPFPAVVSFLPSVSGSRPMSCLIADEALLHSVGNAVWNNLTRQWILLQLRVRLSREMTKFVS